jgi:hypothetical protein
MFKSNTWPTFVMMLNPALQVASGAFVNKDRDGALKRMIYLSASRYSPEQDDPALFDDSGGERDSANGSVTARPTSSTLRKISLTSVSWLGIEIAVASVG